MSDLSTTQKYLQKQKAMALSKVSQTCLGALVLVNGGIGVAFCANPGSVLADVPLFDKTKYSDLAREGLLHLFHIYGTVSLSLAAFAVKDGAVPSTFLLLLLAHAIQAMYETRIFNIYQDLGSAVQPDHLTAVKKATVMQSVMSAIAFLGLLTSASLSAKRDEKSKKK